MIIHQPEISNKNGEVKISARIETRQPIENFPEHLWYSFPEKWAPYLTGRSDPFALSLLLFSMLFREDLEVRGSTSARLAYGLQEYMDVFNTWFPKKYPKIQVKYERLQVSSSRPTDINPGVGSPFSGGVDSCFTLWRHLPQNTHLPDEHLSHLFFIYGFNIHYREKEKLDIVADKLSAVADELGLDFITATTNTRDFLPWISWVFYDVAGRIGVPLALGHLFKRVYLPVEFASPYIPHAANPLLNHLASTEDTTFIDHSELLSRGDKLRQMADWEIAQYNLRVCNRLPVSEDQLNCSRCSKCIRTMVVLNMNGLLEKYRTFVYPVTLKSFYRWGLEADLPDHGLTVTPQYALKQKKYKYLLLIWFAHLVAIIKTFISFILPDKIKMQVKKFIYPPRESTRTIS